MTELQRKKILKSIAVPLIFPALLWVIHLSGYLFDLKLSGMGILPNVHRIASLLKRWLLGTHQSYLNKNKIEYYLDEYVFRYNRRTSTSRGLLFLRLIEQAVITLPVSYKEIINQNHG